MLWRYLGSLLDAASASTAAGWTAIESILDTKLKLSAQQPYLVPTDRLPSLLRGARLFELALLAPGQPRAMLAVEEAFCQHLGLRSEQRLHEVLTQILHGTSLRVFALSPGSPDPLREDAGLRSLLVMDVELVARQQSGWARLVLGAQLRLGVPPPPSQSALRRAWERRQRLYDVPVSLCIEAGYGFLPGHEVLGLQPQDIVLLDHFGPKPIVGGAVWLRLGGGVFPAHLDGAGVTVLGSFHLRAQAMSQATSEPKSEQTSVNDASPTANDALLRELPVQITCEVGRVSLSGREVLELRPGAVLPVGRPLAGPVDLTTSGRLIARGELVDVEGEIGVRVTEVVD